MAADATNKPKDRLRVQVRWQIRRDLDDVLAIESKSHEFPWDEAEFLAAMKPRTRVCMVAELSTTKADIVIGYILYELEPKRLVIINMAVDPEYQRRGVGSQLIAKLIGKMDGRDDRTCISLMVDETNLVAQMFFAACGFKGVFISKDYYVIDCNESRDAYAMAWSLKT